MHIITIGVESISISSELPNNTTTVQLYGISGDEITNKEELQTSINRLIDKHESEFSLAVEEVEIICDVLGHEIIKAPKLQKLPTPAGKVITHAFTMKTCKIYETFNDRELNIVLSCFTNVGVNVEKVWSFFSLFTLNAKHLIDSQKIGVIHIAKQITLYTFDGAGSLKDIYRINRGLSDIIQYISLATTAKFPHLTRRAVTLVIQHFICFSELDMIEKIHTAKGMNKELMTVVNYETVKFVSQLLLKYLRQIWIDINPPQDCKTIIIHTQREFAQNIQNVLSIVSSQDVIAINKEWIKPIAELKGKSGLIKDILRIFSGKL
jgi:hypothetical protein